MIIVARAPFRGWGRVIGTVSLQSVANVFEDSWRCWLLALLKKSQLNFSFTQEALELASFLKVLGFKLLVIKLKEFCLF